VRYAKRSQNLCGADLTNAGAAGEPTRDHQPSAIPTMSSREFDIVGDCSYLRPIQRFDDLFGKMRPSPSEGISAAKTRLYQPVRFSPPTVRFSHSNQIGTDEAARWRKAHGEGETGPSFRVLLDISAIYRSRMIFLEPSVPKP
jgi:hypothetical protein